MNFKLSSYLNIKSLYCFLSFINDIIVDVTSLRMNGDSTSSSRASRTCEAYANAVSVPDFFSNKCFALDSVNGVTLSFMNARLMKEGCNCIG